MGSRKRVKPNPAAESSAPTMSSTSTISSQNSSKPSPSRESTMGGAAQPKVPLPADNGTPRNSIPGSGAGTPTPPSSSKQAHKTRSWYGSWPRVPKSAASTQVARETILGGTTKPKGTADFSRFESRKASDAVSISETPPEGSAVSKTPEDDIGAGQARLKPAPSKAETVKKTEIPKQPEQDDTEMTGAGEEEQRPGPPAEQPATSELAAQRPASSWFGWLSKPITTEPVPSSPASGSEEVTQGVTALALAETNPGEIKAPEPVVEVLPAQPVAQPIDINNQPPAQNETAPASAGSWLWSWSSRNAPVSTESQPAPPVAEAERAPPPTKEPEDAIMQDAPAPAPVPEPPAPPPKVGSTWAFWSRDTSSASTEKPVQQEEQGRLAVMGETSETQPKRTNSMDFKTTPAKEPPLKGGRKDEQAKAASEPSRQSSSKSSKRARPESMGGGDATPARPSTPQAKTTTKSTPKTPTTTKALPPNLLLPSFNGTYKLKENPSIIKQIAQLLLRTQQQPAKHVYLAKEPPKIKKALAIGVHGLFPATYLRPMIGQPTGTSIKFANHCAEAIRRWADSHGCEDCEIEKVALEGEGKIGERVENLWKLLLNWIDPIRNADLILIACHSQGVPVSIMLLAKLIELGVVTSAKVGVCAMAGVSLGPFPDYRSSMGILMGSAAELWEFADSQSEVSKRLEAAMKVVLSHGARITYVGSIDDQLVPLESAIYAPAHHPYIFRSVFIDGRIHAPDFIAHLVGFALKLRNLGVSDHGLIRELSTPLAGSLYSGEGHSRLYDDAQVYDLAVTHVLETADVAAGPASVPACEVRHYRPSSSTGSGGGAGSGSGGGGGGGGGAGLSNPNPYHLPWIMRGVLEEDFVKTELSAETAELVRQFDDWKPVTKALKDVKYRLEAVRSKL